MRARGRRRRAADLHPDPGNRTDVTVEEIVEAMARYGLVQRIWVMDRGMTSANYLETK